MKKHFFINCLFVANESRGAGGGAVLNSYLSQAGNSTQFINCVFSRNVAKGNGGAIAKMLDHDVDKQMLRVDTLIARLKESRNASHSTTLVGIEELVFHVNAPALLRLAVCAVLGPKGKMR